MSVALSQLLQDNWNLTSSLAVANIAWPTSRLEAIGITQGGTIQVAVYNNSPSKQVDPLSHECYLIHEKFVVDVCVRNASVDHDNLVAVEVALKTIIQEVFRIIHFEDPNYEVTGEPIHSDSPEITRCMIIVDAVYFHILT